MPETKLVGIDISQDMLNHVRSQRLATKPKLICGDAVDYLASCVDIYHGITLGQAWQYFRKTRFVEVAASALKSGGGLLVLQNTRVGAGLADAYDTVAEAYIPGYSRTERSFDIAAEIGVQAGNVFDISTRSMRWSRAMTRQNWTALVRSSSLLKRVEKVAGQLLWEELDAAFTENSKDGVAHMNYELQVVTARKF